MPAIHCEINIPETESLMFKKALRHLFNSTFVLREKEEKLYRFIARESNRFEISQYLQVIGYDILVDCLLGTGFNGPVRGLFYEAIQAINQSKAYVISVDINSGMNGDTGKGGPVVKSDLTVTIGYLKAGMLLGDAVWSIGKLVVADIGIRLIRDDYFLAKPEEAVFPHSDLSLDGDHVALLTPGEAEDLSKAGQTIPDVAQELALRSRRLVRVLGRYALATDGYRTYFLEAGEYPQVIQVG